MAAPAQRHPSWRGVWRVLGICAAATPCAPPQTSEYKHQRQAFDAKALEWTRRHAMADAEVGLAARAADAVQAAAAEPKLKQQQQQEHERQGSKENGSVAVNNHNVLAAVGQQQDVTDKRAAERAGGAEQPVKRSRLALRK